MKVFIGKDSVKHSWQAEFHKDVECCQPDCDGKARIAFVAIERNEGEGNYVCSMYPNEGGSGGDFWLHDACAVAVYFCRKCLNPTAKYNQA